jgi:hypothetical protein
LRLPDIPTLAHGSIVYNRRLGSLNTSGTGPEQLDTRSIASTP